MSGWGAAVRQEWDLDPAFLTVNHGSYGATPRVVLAAQREWQRRMEAQPVRFFGREAAPALRAAAGRLAAFVGARSDDLVFIENATAGCNTVLRALDFAAGDEILVLSHGYGAVTKAARYVASRTGARVVEAPVPFPRADEDALVAAVVGAITPRTKLALLDHITSGSALVLPMARLTAACHVAGVPVLVDGAHAPGNLDLDVPATGADWYVGNCHKWLCAPKGCAFLWVQPERQAGLHPLVISHGYGQGFLAEFDWIGTRDISAWLAVTAALDFHERLGGSGLRARNRALAAEAATMLAGRFGTETGLGNGAPQAMALVRLPIAGDAPPGGAPALWQRTLDLGTDAQLPELGGAIWLRISAQAYNTLDDYERLADLLTAELSQAPLASN
jgi:isopenicillin-N epimerase